MVCHRLAGHPPKRAPTSHETFETITDPDGTAWWNSLDNGLFGQEIGDECSFLLFIGNPNPPPSVLVFFRSQRCHSEWQTLRCSRNTTTPLMPVRLSLDRLIPWTREIGKVERTLAWLEFESQDHTSLLSKRLL